MNSSAAGAAPPSALPSAPAPQSTAAPPPPADSASKRDKPSCNPFSACFRPGPLPPPSPPQRPSAEASAQGSSRPGAAANPTAQGRQASDLRRSAARATVHVSPRAQRGSKSRSSTQDASKSLDSVGSASEPTQGPRSRPAASAARAHGPSRPQNTCESMVLPASAVGASTLEPPSIFASTVRLQSTLPRALTGPDIKPPDVTASATARSPTSTSMAKTSRRDAFGRSCSTVSSGHEQDFHTRELTLKLNNEVRLRQQYQAATEKLTMKCQELQSRLSSQPDKMSRRLLRSMGASSGGLDSLPELTSTWIIPWKELEFGPVVARGFGEETRTARYLGMTVTVKEVTASGGSSRGASHAEERFFSEVNALAAVRHPNCALFMGCCLLPEEGRYYIVTEYLSNGTVFDRTHGSDRSVFLTNPQWLHRVALSVCQTMVYLHSRSPVIVHRNLTTRSLLCDDNLGVKISDFGLSLMYRKSEGSNPETLTGDEDREKPIDVYCYGMLLWELVTGCAPFNSSRLTPDDAVTLVKSFAKQSARPPIPDSTNPSLRALISACWAQQPSLRPSFTEVLPVLEAPHAAEWLFARGDVRFSTDLSSQSRSPPLTARSITTPGLYPLRLPNFAAPSDVLAIRAQLRPTHLSNPSRHPFPPDSFRKPLSAYADALHGFALQPSVPASRATPRAVADELGSFLGLEGSAQELYRRSATAPTPAEQLVVPQGAGPSARADDAAAALSGLAPRQLSVATSLPFDLGGIAQGDAKEQIDALFSIEAESSGAAAWALRSRGTTAADAAAQRAPPPEQRYGTTAPELVSPGWASAGNLPALQNRTPRNTGAAAHPRAGALRDHSRNTVDALWSREDRDSGSASASVAGQHFALQQLESSSPEDSEENIQGASSLLELLKPSELAPGDLHRLLQAAPGEVAAERRRRGAAAAAASAADRGAASAVQPEARSAGARGGPDAPAASEATPTDAVPRAGKSSFAYSYASDVPIGESRCIVNRVHKGSASPPQPGDPDTSPTLTRRRAPSPFRRWWPLNRHARPEQHECRCSEEVGPLEGHVDVPANCDALPDAELSIRSSGSTFYNLQSVSVLNKTREMCGDDDTQQMTSSTPSSASPSTRLLCMAGDAPHAAATASKLDALHARCAELAADCGDGGKLGGPPPPAAAPSGRPACECARARGVGLPHDASQVSELGGGASAFTIDDLRVGGGDVCEASGCRCGAAEGRGGRGDAERTAMSTHSLFANSGLEWVYTEQEGAVLAGAAEASRLGDGCAFGSSPAASTFETATSWRENGLYDGPDDAESAAAQLLGLSAPAPPDVTVFDCPLFVPRRGAPEAAVARGARAQRWGCRRSASALDVVALHADADQFDASGLQRALSAPHRSSAPARAAGDAPCSSAGRCGTSASGAPVATTCASSAGAPPKSTVDALRMLALSQSPFNVPGALLHPSCLHWSLENSARPLCLAPLEVRVPKPSAAAEVKTALAPDADRAPPTAQDITAQLRTISEEEVTTMSPSSQALRSLCGPPALSQMSTDTAPSSGGTPPPPFSPQQPRTVAAAFSAAAGCLLAPRPKRSAPV